MFSVAVASHFIPSVGMFSQHWKRRFQLNSMSSTMHIPSTIIFNWPICVIVVQSNEPNELNARLCFVKFHFLCKTIVLTHSIRLKLIFFRWKNSIFKLQNKFALFAFFFVCYCLLINENVATKTIIFFKCNYRFCYVSFVRFDRTGILSLLFCRYGRSTKKNKLKIIGNVLTKYWNRHLKNSR